MVQNLAPLEVRAAPLSVLWRRPSRSNSKVKDLAKNRHFWLKKITLALYAFLALFGLYLALFGPFLTNLKILYKYTIPPTHIVCITYFRDAQMHRLYSD